ncbi:MAG: DUF4340 domain-containing protein [Bacteriovorax sp.]|nr:DUF4340 domain-containing protein [Bacteriovorax sp.]
MSTKKIASNVVLFLFFILVAMAALLSDIFQNPIKTGTQVIEQAKLFTSSDLDQVKRLILKNKSGEYIFERNENNQISPWHMIAPRDISANSLFIDKLFSSLAVIKVKKVFPDEKMTLSNFSLDKPTATLSFIYQNGKTTAVTIGLMNSIDNSTYLKIQNRVGIFHVEAPSVALENASLLDLIESQILSINLETIVNFKISQGNKKNSAPQIEIKKKNGQWLDHQENLLDKEKVDDFFQDLSSLKSSFIIDRPTETQKKQINMLTQNTSFMIIIEDNMGTITEYRISEIFQNISDLDLKNEDHFLVGISNTPTLYIVKKEFFELFNRKIESLKIVKTSP